MFLKVRFLNFRYFFITFKHISISVNHWREHYVNSTISHFAFKTSLAIFKFMKVELKYWRFANWNDAIFKTDIASLKYPNKWLLYKKILNSWPFYSLINEKNCRSIGKRRSRGRGICPLSSCSPRGIRAPLGICPFFFLNTNARVGRALLELTDA